MRASDLFLGLFQFLIPPVVILTTLLYFYPAAQLCQFPNAKASVASCLIDGTPGTAGELAPFRLLTFADPQLEGDTSIPEHTDFRIFSLEQWRTEGLGRVQSLIKDEVPRRLRAYQKRLDLWGNDLYLAHIYRLMHWWTNPTHTVVLGDLLGSQWIPDEEFDRRTDRFWKRVFKHATKVPREITESSGRVEVLGQDPTWKRRLIALAGNHDIGYAGDIDGHRIQRFEKSYGSVNWDIRFQLNDSRISYSPFKSPPELRLIILNSMNLDTPVLEHEYYKQSIEFITEHMHGSSKANAKETGTIVLTHIPFHKEEGICVDGPMIAYDDNGLLKEQNHLSKDMSTYLLEGMSRPNRPGTAIVMNGHDHEGCDTFHSLSNQTDDNHEESKGPKWHAEKIPVLGSPRFQGKQGLREITVRSMMGSYWGNTGMLSAWYDFEIGEWRYEYDVCAVGIQHIWWGVHIFDLIVVGMGLLGIILFFIESDAPVPPRKGVRAPPAGKSKNV